QPRLTRIEPGGLDVFGTCIQWWHGLSGPALPTRPHEAERTLETPLGQGGRHHVQYGQDSARGARGGCPRGDDPAVTVEVAQPLPRHDRDRARGDDPMMGQIPSRGVLTIADDDVRGVPRRIQVTSCTLGQVRIDFYRSDVSRLD